MSEIIYQGVLYTAQETSRSTPDNWKGFGGRHFTVRFADGHIIQTDNLFMVRAARKPDTCTIHEGWAEPTEKNRCIWAWSDGMQFFQTLETVKAPNFEPDGTPSPSGNKS